MICVGGVCEQGVRVSGGLCVSVRKEGDGEVGHSP